jgi:hypothetical protein
MLTLEETNLNPTLNFFPLSKWSGMLQLITHIKNYMKFKNLLDLMWKASINSNWTKGAQLGPKEFVKVTTNVTKLIISFFVYFYPLQMTLTS